MLMFVIGENTSSKLQQSAMTFIQWVARMVGCFFWYCLFGPRAYVVNIYLGWSYETSAYCTGHHIWTDEMYWHYQRCPWTWYGGRLYCKDCRLSKWLITFSCKQKQRQSEVMLMLHVDWWQRKVNLRYGHMVKRNPIFIRFYSAECCPKRCIRVGDIFQESRRGTEERLCLYSRRFVIHDRCVQERWNARRCEIEDWRSGTIQCRKGK